MANQHPDEPENGEVGETQTPGAPSDPAPFNSFQLRRLRKRISAGEVVDTAELRQAYRYLMEANQGDTHGSE